MNCPTRPLGHDLELLVVVLEQLVLLDDLGIAAFPALRSEKLGTGPQSRSSPPRRPRGPGPPSPGPTAPLRFPPSSALSERCCCCWSRRPPDRRPMAHAAAHAACMGPDPPPSAASTSGLQLEDPAGPHMRLPRDLQGGGPGAQGFPRRLRHRCGQPGGCACAHRGNDARSGRVRSGRGPSRRGSVQRGRGGRLMSPVPGAHPRLR